MKTMYYNKCRVCGTTLVIGHKLETCEACGSDDIYCKKHKFNDKPAPHIKIDIDDAAIAAAIEKTEAENNEKNATLAKKIVFAAKALAAATATIAIVSIVRAVLKICFGV